MESIPPPLNPRPTGTPEAPGTPWGLWPTFGFAAVIAGVYIGVTIVVYIVFVMIQAARSGKGDSGAIETDGLFFATASLAASMVCTVLVIGGVALRKGIRIADYLKLRRLRGRDLLIWPFLLLALFAPLEWVRIEIIGKPLVPDFMLDAYRNCDVLPILWLAVIVGAPLGEEFFFRGFLFEGIRHSRLGGIAAVIICAVTWAVIHLQYDLIDMSVVFLGGLFLGVAKLRTGNLWIPVILHFLWNLVAMIQTAYVAGQSS